MPSPSIPLYLKDAIHSKLLLAEAFINLGLPEVARYHIQEAINILPSNALFSLRETTESLTMKLNRSPKPHANS